MKPKRIGTYMQRWVLRGVEEWPPDRHPVYEYRGYIIVRQSPINNFRQSYFEIYVYFENGEPSYFHFDLNPEKGFRRLQDASDAIDNYLAEKDK